MVKHAIWARPVVHTCDPRFVDCEPDWNDFASRAPRAWRAIGAGEWGMGETGHERSDRSVPRTRSHRRPGSGRRSTRSSSRGRSR